MKFTLCNEVLRELPFAAQASMAAALGYRGLEPAPFTFGEDAYRMPKAQRAELQRMAADAGIAISGIHWLLAAPAGLSITSADAAVRARTLDIMRHLVEFCADLGGEYLVHGSPGQRMTAGDPAARRRGEEAFGLIAPIAAAAGLRYCIEPLAPPDADFINTVAEAASIVRRIANPALLTMLDASAVGNGEARDMASLLGEWLPTGLIGHVHLNDRNRRGPGQGADRFGPVLAALRANRYGDWIGIEPFDYVPDGPTSAARAIGYLSGLLETLP